jgi:hypothetical protein
MSEANAPAAEAPRRAGWLGPLRLPAGLGRHLLAAADRLADRLGPWHRWLVVGAAVGTLPLLCDVLLGWRGNAPITALALAPLLLAAAARDLPGRGLAAVAVALACHSVLAIFLAAHDPDCLAAVLPDGPDYWSRSQAWITTGTSREYDVGWWLPAHLQLLGVMVPLTYISLGLIPLAEALYQIDLMNFYVGRLLAHSQSPAVALAVGWHPWSLCRGAGYLVLTFELTSLSLSRLAGVRLATSRARRWRWCVGLGFVALDGIIKFTCLESVRQVLAANLR